MSILRIALTTGEPAGIGPDLTVQLAQTQRAHEIIALADPDLLRQRADQLGLPLDLEEYRPDTPPAPGKAGTITVLPVRCQAPVVTGQLNPANAGYVLATLDSALRGCVEGSFQAMVTAPVQKSVINDAGIAFTGHTEYLAEHSGCKQVVMMLACEQMRVALVTTHLPLSQVPAAITPQRLHSVIEILHRDLRQRFGKSNPHITVLGLNPHAGESGHMGREEIDTIIPVLEALRGQGMQLLGPLPADTAFTPKILARTDALLAMYHDQGLPVLKYAGFGNAVNISLGLSLIRTSVDHGTALDIAGTGKADAGSLHYALACAIDMAQASQATP